MQHKKCKQIVGKYGKTLKFLSYNRQNMDQMITNYPIPIMMLETREMEPQKIKTNGFLCNVPIGYFIKLLGDFL